MLVTLFCEDWKLSILQNYTSKPMKPSTHVYTPFEKHVRVTRIIIAIATVYT